jgi:S1-C subfamily serine protease
MRRKYSRISVWLIGLALIGVGVPTMIGGGINRFEPQNPNGPYTFGVTVADIYDRGVIITNVEIGSRAAQAGFRKDDVILAVDGYPVSTTFEFQELISELAGGPASLTVSRFGKIRTVVIDTH